MSSRTQRQVVVIQSPFQDAQLHEWRLDAPRGIEMEPKWPLPRCCLLHIALCSFPHSKPIYHSLWAVENSVDIIPPNEVERLAAVRRYDVLDTPPDGAFDRITALAARMFDVPISIISVVDHDRIWFKSHHGVDVSQIDREPGLFASAILSDEARILLDARLDPHAVANPLVAGAFGLRFYIGVPLHTHDGFNLGTLCVIDKEPREVSCRQIDDLKDLASIVMDALELRRSARQAVEAKSAMLDEMNHRVSNSLQLVSNLLTLQGRGESAKVAELFKAASGRVAAIARAHQQLFQADRVGMVQFKPYFENLCQEISASILGGMQGAELCSEVDDAVFPTHKATAVGLILNELITNAVKYGAGGNRIVVSFRSNDGTYNLSVTDQGAGLPQGFDPSAPKGLGMRVVHSLVQQIGGRLDFSTGDEGRGTRATVIFP